MSIPKDQYEIVRAINIDGTSTECAYEYWENEFPKKTFVGESVMKIKQELGTTFNRSKLIDFFRKNENDAKTKFVAAMIWGHEASLGGRRDSRGPWKVSQMFSDPKEAERAIRNVRLESPAEISTSYKLLSKQLDRCGPNFFTKYFYFLGKASNPNSYPLIFDDRVARGLIKIGLVNQQNIRMVQIGALRKPKAYLDYLSYAKKQADLIECELDQIEYYLFSL